MLLVVCFVILFYYLKWSFMAGIAVFALTFWTNTKLAQAQARVQKAYMRAADGRVKAITESLNNIKMLKLYSWKDAFARLISETRAE